MSTRKTLHDVMSGLRYSLKLSATEDVLESLFDQRLLTLLHAFARHGS